MKFVKVFSLESFLLYGISFASNAFQVSYKNQILMNVKKISMAVITSAPTPLGLIAVAVIQASDLRLIGSLAMVMSIYQIEY